GGEDVEVVLGAVASGGAVAEGGVLARTGPVGAAIEGTALGPAGQYLFPGGFFFEPVAGSGLGALRLFCGDLIGGERGLVETASSAEEELSVFGGDGGNAQEIVPEEAVAGAGDGDEIAPLPTGLDEDVPSLFRVAGVDEPLAELLVTFYGPLATVD